MSARYSTTASNAEEDLKLRLELLRSVAPLISAELDVPPSPPPSPPTVNSVLPLNLKRKATERDGLEQDPDTKRARVVQPAAARPTPLRASFPQQLGILKRPDVEAPPPVPPKSDLRSVPTPPGMRGEESWRLVFTKEKLRALSAGYRLKGREIKHLGDSTAKNAKSLKDTILSIVYHTDAITLFVFASWCDDQAARRCITQGWESIFGLLGFVKAAAKKNGCTVVLSICKRMEAYIAFAIAKDDAKGVHFKVNEQIKAIESNGPTPSLTLTPSTMSSTSNQLSPAESPVLGLSPPQRPSSSSHPSSLDLHRSNSKSTAELFRIQALWEDTLTSLTAADLSHHCPTTYTLALDSITMGINEMVTPIKPWKFSLLGTAELRRAMAIPQGVCYARAVLEEWATKEGLAFESKMVVA